MTTQTVSTSRDQHTVLLDKARVRPQRFTSLHPTVASNSRRVEECVADFFDDSLWISYNADLLETLVRKLSETASGRRCVLVLHPIDPCIIPALEALFKRVAFATAHGFLSPEELDEALSAENRADLFIGGSVDENTKTITLWRGNLEAIVIPFSAFPSSGDGTRPDFSDFGVTDYGQTIRLGKYEAAADAILYEFDREYRRHIAKERLKSERSFGASLRRLRKQRGLGREDFAPLAAKTIARIERGEVEKDRIQPRTLRRIASQLSVEPEEIESY